MEKAEALQPSERLGPYEALSFVAPGGMGEDRRCARSGASARDPAPRPEARNVFLVRGEGVFSPPTTVYELLSGNRPFRGATTAQVLSAVLRDDPPECGNEPVGAGVLDPSLGTRRAHEAAALARLVIQADPLHGVLWHLLAFAVDVAGQTNEAERLYRRALELESRLFIAYEGLATNQACRGILKDAVASAERAHALARLGIRAALEARPSLWPNRFDSTQPALSVTGWSVPPLSRSSSTGRLFFEGKRHA